MKRVFEAAECDKVRSKDPQIYFSEIIKIAFLLELERKIEKSHCQGGRIAAAKRGKRWMGSGGLLTFFSRT